MFYIYASIPDSYVWCGKKESGDAHRDFNIHRTIERWEIYAIKFRWNLKIEHWSPFTTSLTWIVIIITNITTNKLNEIEPIARQTSTHAKITSEKYHFLSLLLISTTDVVRVATTAPRNDNSHHTDRKMTEAFRLEVLIQKLFMNYYYLILHLLYCNPINPVLNLFYQWIQFETLGCALYLWTHKI